MNSVLDVMARRYTCRAFADTDVQMDVMRQIGNAALTSPSGMNRQHWQIVVVSDKKLIEDMDSEGMKNLASTNEFLYQRINSRGGKLFYNAPKMIFVAVKKAEPQGAELVDLGIVSQNIALAATSLGVDSCICGLVGFCFMTERAKEFYRRLQVFEGYECGLAVLLGYARQKGEPHKPDPSKLIIV